MVLARGSAFRPCSILAISDKLSSDLSATSCCDKCAASRSVRSRYAIFLDSPIEGPPWRPVWNGCRYRDDSDAKNGTQVPFRLFHPTRRARWKSLFLLRFLIGADHFSGRQNVPLH